MKGIILAGGSGTRLHPATLAINKQLLPVYDKPMIYYPLSVLMLAGIREILIISSPECDRQLPPAVRRREPVRARRSNMPSSRRPDGLAQAFLIGETSWPATRGALVLGDNIFFGAGLTRPAGTAPRPATHGATVFAYHVEDPTAYGVVELDADGRADQPRGEAGQAASPTRR